MQDIRTKMVSSLIPLAALYSAKEEIGVVVNHYDGVHSISEALYRTLNFDAATFMGLVLITLFAMGSVSTAIFWTWHAAGFSTPLKRLWKMARHKRR